MPIEQQDILNTIKSMKTTGETQETTSMPEALPSVVSETLKKSRETTAGISVKAVISYESLSGNIKTREFLIRRIIQNGSEYFIDGLALDIKAPRLIRVSQISYIMDPNTEQIYADAYQYVQNVLGVEIDDSFLPEPMSDFAKAIKETSNEITVLMYLVAIDGVRSPEERERVKEYVRKRVPYLNYEDEQMNDYLISLAPDDDSFSMAFHRLLKKGKNVLQPLLEGVLDIIMLDGIVHTKEKAFLARLIDMLRQDGYQIDLPIEADK